MKSKTAQLYQEERRKKIIQILKAAKEVKDLGGGKIKFVAKKDEV